MSRKVRFLAPVDPNNISATAQAIYDFIQSQRDGSGEPSQRRMGDNDRDWTRERIDQLERGDIPGGFAGPNKSYPIGSADDVRDAWSLAELSGDPTMIRFNIKAIAKRCGWQHAIPAGE